MRYRHITSNSALKYHRELVFRGEVPHPSAFHKHPYDRPGCKN